MVSLTIPVALVVWAVLVQRMPQGALCPLELLPAEDCADELRAVLARLRLSERGHVEVYSLAAA